jgi:hypothetical protein
MSLISFVERGRARVRPHAQPYRTAQCLYEMYSTVVRNQLIWTVLWLNGIAEKNKNKSKGQSPRMREP